MGRGGGQCLVALGTPTRSRWHTYLGWDDTRDRRACAVGCAWACVVLKVYGIKSLH